MDNFFAFICVAFLIASYFVPAIIADKKNNRNANAIFWLNLLAGWSMLGWLIALVWALTNEKAPLPVDSSAQN